MKRLNIKEQTNHPKFRNVYRVTVKSMIGDADAYTYESQTFQLDQADLIIQLHDLSDIAFDRLGYLDGEDDWEKAIANRPDLKPALKHLMNLLDHEANGSRCHFDDLDIKFFNADGVEFDVEVTET